MPTQTPSNPSALSALTPKYLDNSGGIPKVIQPSDQIAFVSAAPAATGATNTTPYGFSTAAQADAIRANVNEMRAALIAVGIMK